MRKILSLASVVAFGLGMAAHGATAAKKKSTAKKGTASTAHKRSGTARPAGSRSSSAARTSASRTAKTRRKRPTVRRTTWRNRQLSPTPDRYKEIQQALAAKGYLTPDQANGKWDDTSTAALRKFQTDQNLDGNGKINSLSLIALGLGPKHETATVAKPTAPDAAAPTPPTANP